MGASWWNSRLCESPVSVFYSRKGCRRISSHSTACPWEYQGCQKIGRFCKDHYNAERTISKPGHKHRKIPTENITCSMALFKVVGKAGWYQ